MNSNSHLSSDSRFSSTEIYQLLETIAASPKKTDKERLLREAACPKLERVLKAAYDPTISYYIKKVAPSTSANEGNFDAQIYHMLDMFSTRQWVGEEAKTQLNIELAWLNLESQELLTRIIKRDLRCGISAATINKVFPKLIPEYPYMQYSLFKKIKPDSLSWKDGVYVQLKMDGLYMSVDYYKEGSVVGLSRQGSEMPEDCFADIFNHIKANFESGYQYHGEVLVLCNGEVLPREIGNGIANSIQKGGVLPEGHSLKFVVWDMVKLDAIQGNETCKHPYKERFTKLSNFAYNDSVSLVKTIVVHSLQDAFKVYQKALARGEEGVMLKSSDLMWKDHKTIKGCKLKLEVDVDLEIVGFTEGRGKNASTFGSISMQTRDGCLKVDVSGMSDDLRLYIHLNRDKLLGTIATVCANDVTKTEPASLFLPRLVELRSDKLVADSLEEVVEQFENAKAGL